MPRRGSIRVPHTFEQRVAAEKSQLEAQAAKLRPGQQKDELLHKIAQLETAARINELAEFSGASTAKDSLGKAAKGSRQGTHSGFVRARPIVILIERLEELRMTRRRDLAAD